MPITKLEPLRLKDEFYLNIEKALADYFYRLIYAPMYNEVADEIGKDWAQIYNAKSQELAEPLQKHLLKMLVTGRVQYLDGRFYGGFDSRVTRAIKSLGGVYDVRGKFFSLPEKKLTDNIRIAIGTAYSKFEKVHGQIIKRLDDLQSAIDSGNLAIFDPREQIGVTVRKMDRDLNKTLKPLTIDYKPSDNLVEFILEKYGNDLTKYIKNWNIETIQRLRDRVSSNAFSGYRASSLAEEIAADYGVSARKAKFLARQETSLMLSTFREGRYKEVGIEEYEWQTAGDSRVRDMHKHLNRKIFSWENPPIIDDYGHRGNPGEAFGCRCVAAPVL